MRKLQVEVKRTRQQTTSRAHDQAHAQIELRLSPAGDCKGFCTLNIEDGQVLYPSSKEL
jgi:hypothetical protein